MSVPELVTEHAVILPPNSEEGIIVYTIIGYTESTLSEFKPFTCKTPLKTYSKLRANKGDPLDNSFNSMPRINKDRYNYIYLRAPSSYPITVDKAGRPSLIEDPSVLSSDAIFPLWNGGMNDHNIFAVGGLEHGGSHLVKVRVDPERTYVFFSEYRYLGGPVLSTKIKLSDFINKLKADSIAPNPDPRFYGWEIVVKTPTIPPKYYVKCVANPFGIIDRIPPKNPAELLYYNKYGPTYIKGFNDFIPIFSEQMKTYKRIDRHLDLNINRVKNILADGDYNRIEALSNAEAEQAIQSGRVPRPSYTLLNQLMPSIGSGTAKITFEGILNPLTDAGKESFQQLSKLINNYIDALDAQDAAQNLVFSKSKKSKASIDAAIAAARAAVIETQKELMTYLRSLGAVKSAAAASAKGGSRKSRKTRKTRRRRV